MKGIKSIIYEINGQTLIINISENSQIIYKDISTVISQEKILDYLSNLFIIIDNWDQKYIDPRIIDGGIWKLSIIFFNGNKKEYIGKANYPNNFEVFERLNNKLIKEVENG